MLATIRTAVLGLFLSSCVTTTQYASAPGIVVEWATSRTDRPWLGLEESLSAALQVIQAHYPGVRCIDLLGGGPIDSFRVIVWAGNDSMVDNSCTPAVQDPNGHWSLLAGCTTVVRSEGHIHVKQQRIDPTYKDETVNGVTKPNIDWPVFDYKKPLVPAHIDYHDMKSPGAILLEIADRWVPLCLGKPSGHDIPEWMALHSEMQALALKLLQAKPSP